eukprot:TRINITY_DN812_c0_g1_i2.p1 TRINITY_DN812_c0_g1~~TRINITY_DN812_c0_g1_i2.p1  ORF type:complete len:115 (+),score=5.40 TRINITY_DN812_c0_g1_i2:67-411(+)
MRPLQQLMHTVWIETGRVIMRFQRLEKNKGCIDIASQFVDNQNHSLDILMGGGRRHFCLNQRAASVPMVKNLVTQWQSKGHYVSSLKQLQALQQEYKKEELSGGDLKPCPCTLR